VSTGGPNEATRALAFGLLSLSISETLPMAIANITIFVRRAWLMAFVAGVALFAHTLGFLRFGVHEACTFPRADIQVCVQKGPHRRQMPSTMPCEQKW
jgi:non-homologous end joining protein Ku